MKQFHPIQGKTVHIIFQSKGLGDTLAWFPYVEQFRVENKCNVKLFLPRTVTHRSLRHKRVPFSSINDLHASLLTQTPFKSGKFAPIAI